MSAHLKNWSDAKLYYWCAHYGEQARKWRQRFLGLLPEVHRRGLYEKKGFSSIFEFAAKLAGISKEQVQRVLQLEERFEDKPALKTMLENGEVSVNKLARIASIATPENQEVLAQQVQILPKAALETLVRDEKFARQTAPASTATHDTQNALDKPKFHHNSVPGHRIEDQSIFDANLLELSEEAKSQLYELKQKGIDISKLIIELLRKRVMEIAQEKERLAAGLIAGSADVATSGAARLEDSAASTYSSGTGKDSRVRLEKSSRYIPVKIKRILQKEHGDKCSIQSCQRKAETIHHTQRFALSRSHDPHFLAPLCKQHHIIAHSIDLKFHESRLFAGP